jgi:hypothetical protein
LFSAGISDKMRALPQIQPRNGWLGESTEIRSLFGLKRKKKKQTKFAGIAKFSSFVRIRKCKSNTNCPIEKTHVGLRSQASYRRKAKIRGLAREPAPE